MPQYGCSNLQQGGGLIGHVRWPGRLSRPCGGRGLRPKVLFDQHSGRFFIVVLEGSSPALSVVHIAVSTTSAPSNTTTDWTKLSGSAVTSIPSCGPCLTWFDYPGIGADSNSLFVTGNLFDAGSSFRGVKIRVFDKSAVTGLLAGIHSFVDINVDDAATGFGTFTIQPAHVFGATDNGNFRELYRIVTSALDGLFLGDDCAYRLLNFLT